ncbi:hypothetical protein [Embleya sp. MST-111070]|uniref:hypothetical protein n=1 Tax=Embleya sp. MST-111070 TaxID=3398231 RepID=UPI003F737DB1
MTDSTRRTIRTVVQAVLGLAAGLPLIITASGIPETAAGVGVILAVAAGVTRVMALPVVQQLMPSWLRTDPVPNGDLRALLRKHPDTGDSS